MAATGRKRKILRTLGVLIVGLMLLVLALPLWFPVLVRPILHRLGINYAHYQRMGYGRFALVGASFTNANLLIRADKVEGPIATAWLWHRIFDREPVTCLSAQNWKIEVLESKTKSQRRTPLSMYDYVHRIASTISIIHKWAPKGVLTNGVIEIHGKMTATISLLAPTATTNLQLRLPSAAWVKGTLSAAVEIPADKVKTAVQARIGTARHEVDLDFAPVQFRSTMRFSEMAAGLSVQSTHWWLNNRIEVAARFGRNALLPEQAKVEADSFQVPAAFLRLSDFEDLTGSAFFQWQANQFTVNLDATAHATTAATFPPVELRVQSTGSLHSAFIETARISTPWLLAELTPGTEIQFTSPFLKQEAVLNTVFNLSQQSWFDAKGKLEGEARLCPAERNFPSVSFEFSGAGIGISKFETKTLALSGELVWPWLDISSMSIGLADGSRASLSGRFQAEQRIVRDGHLQLEGQFARQWLPAGYSFERASATGAFSGPIRSLAHSGQLTLQNFTSPALHPLELRAGWDGEGRNLQRCDVAANAGNSSCKFQGAVAITNSQANLNIKALTFEQNRHPVMELDKACQLRLSNTTAHTLWVRLEPFRWRGDGENRQLDLEAEVGWPAYGHVRATGTNLNLGVFADFFKALPGDITVGHLDGLADWNSGPANLGLNLSASMNREGIPFSAQAVAKGDGKGILLQSLDISSKAQPVFSAQGFLPLTLTLSEPRQWLNFVHGPPLNLKVITQTNSLFWDELAVATGVVLLEPELSLDVSGTWLAPHGNLEMQVKEIKWPHTWRASGKAVTQSPNVSRNKTTESAAFNRGMQGEALTLEDVHLSLELEQDGAHIKQLTLLLQKQPITLTADMPLGKEFWASVEARKPRVDLEKVRGRLTMQDAQLAPFTRLRPNVLIPQGQLNLDVALLPGGKLDGELRVSGASTVPLANFGAVRDIEMRMKIVDRAVELKSITASFGGSPISASGSADLRGVDWLKGVPPPFQLKFHGQNLPLARDPDFVVRGDIDAVILKEGTGVPGVSGMVRLRDSFFLRDLNDLLPGGVESASSRPPYFSIQTKPFADWRLDLELKGDHFLKVNSPLFRGVLSADLKLAGTLKEPVALGNLKINSGLVQFPFANLEVTEGFVTLTSENPYRPQLLVTAGSRRAAYDVKMEITGPADQPLVQFSSAPPLTSEQIVLMITAGELPRTEFTLSTRQRAQTFALYLGKNLLSQVGLPQQSDRLSIQTGEYISETGSLTYRVEYKLSNRWYLTGEYDRFNAINVGLKWRIYSK